MRPNGPQKAWGLLPAAWAPARLLSALAAYVIACGALYLVSFTWFQAGAVDNARVEATLYQRSLRNALEQFQHLPPMLAQDPFVIEAAAGGETILLNERLAGFAQNAELDAIYLMNRQGLTIAASNHAEAGSFVGQTYEFRPYFRQALAGGTGEFFAIGATTLKPGYFIAAPVFANDATASRQVIGVVALKLDLRDVSTAWKGAQAPVFVTNGDGIVTLATNADWLYQIAADLPARRAAAVREARQFADEPLTPLNLSRESSDTLRLDNRTYVVAEVAIGRLGWVLHYLIDASVVRAKAAQTIILASLVLFVLGAVAIALRAARVGRALRTSQADRRRLAATNLQLEREIAERRTAEQALSAAQADLARVSRLAALGELAASVTHELGQPISAMRTYLAAEEIGGQTSPVIARLSAIVTRMEGVTRQLRFFARPGAVTFSTIDLRDVAKGAERMVAHDGDGTDLTLNLSNAPVLVSGDPLRLEQVAINLVRNALLAVEPMEERRVTVTVTAETGMARLQVDDTGPGLEGQSLETLQEPFHTTRASGEGMGLGLSISAGIVREHDGQMRAETSGQGGARFIVELPLAVTP